MDCGAAFAKTTTAGCSSLAHRRPRDGTGSSPAADMSSLACLVLSAQADTSSLACLDSHAYILKATQSAESPPKFCGKSAYIATTKFRDKSAKS